MKPGLTLVLRSPRSTRRSARSHHKRWSALRIFPPVADVVAGGIVVPTVHISCLWSIEVHRDRRALAQVPYSVDATVARQYGRGSVLRAPRQLPDLLQAGVVGARAIVQALVALFEHRADGAAIGSLGGVVVDLGLGSRRPDEDLQGVRTVHAFVAVGHVPLSCAPGLF